MSSKSAESSLASSPMPRSDYIKMEQQVKRLCLQTALLKKQLHGIKTMRSEDKKVIDEQRQTIAELSSQVAAQDLKINDLDRRLSEFSRQLEERYESGSGSQRTVSRRRKAAATATEDNESAGTSYKTKRARRK